MPLTRPSPVQRSSTPQAGSMDNHTYGGGFLYHLEGNKVTLGFVVGLDYANPWLSPFEEMQRWKTHPPCVRIEGGKRISYGARAITAGGILSLPKHCVFPGGALGGLRGGLLNTSRIRAATPPSKTGMLFLSKRRLKHPPRPPAR